MLSFENLKEELSWRTKISSVLVKRALFFEQVVET